MSKYYSGTVSNVEPFEGVRIYNEGTTGGFEDGPNDFISFDGKPNLVPFHATYEPNPLSVGIPFDNSVIFTNKTFIVESQAVENIMDMGIDIDIDSRSNIGGSYDAVITMNNKDSMVLGLKNNVGGESNHVIGQRNLVLGSRNLVQGNDLTVIGDDNQIICLGCKLTFKGSGISFNLFDVKREIAKVLNNYFCKDISKMIRDLAY